MLPSATLIKNVLARCRDDYVGLWAIVRRVKEDLSDQSQLMDTTLTLLSKLLKEDGIAAGTFEGHVFCTWDQPVDKILQKIEAEWKDLGRDPDIGEIVWFTARKGLQR